MLLAVAITTAGARAGPIVDPLRSAIESLGSHDEISVIASLRERLDLESFRSRPLTRRSDALVRGLRSHASRTQGPLLEFLRERGASRVQPIWLVNAIAVRARRAVITELASRSEIESIRADVSFALPEGAVGDPVAAPWSLEAIRAPELWAQGLTGAGAVVGTLDSGADLAHADLGGRWRGGANSWFDPNGEHATPYDADGHGTRTLGLIVGGSAGGSPIGVAPGAQWIAVKIFDDAGVASASAIHLGFEWLLDPDGDPATDDAPGVVNGSWFDAQSIGTCDPEFELDLEILRVADIAVTLAAGNAGPYPDTSVSPANLPSGWALGAVDAELEVASFSSRGPSACDGGVFPDLAAPGVDVRTADLTLGGIFPYSYVAVSGTSFSAAHVAGAVALLRSAFPDADVEQVRSALEQSANDLGTPGLDPDSGHGLADAVAAQALLAATPACSDGVDNDGDGAVDFPADPGCRGAAARLEDPACDDGIDNDGDGLVDYAEDPQCTSPWRRSEATSACGLGWELAGIFAALRRRRSRRRSGTCRER